MIAGHRWAYDVDRLGYVCVGLPSGGVESYQWCTGCGVFVSDEELCDKRIPSAGMVCVDVTLDTMAAGKGHSPVQAGTMAAHKFHNSYSQIGEKRGN